MVATPLERGGMAVNRIRGAFAVPKKGETFELRAGLVYETTLNCSIIGLTVISADRSMRTKGTTFVQDPGG